MGQYLPVLAMIVLAVLFGALSRVGLGLLAPRRSTAAKRRPTSAASSRPSHRSGSRCASSSWR